MTERLTRSPEQLRELAERVLGAAGASRENAASLAAALVLAELDGVPAHGLARLPGLVEDLRRGAVDGRALPEVSLPSPVAVRVDGRGGFAVPARDLAVAAVQEVVEQYGLAMAAVVDARHPGLAGHAAEALAGRGMVALALGGAGGPAFACPRRNEPPLVVESALDAALPAELESWRTMAAAVAATAGGGEVLTAWEPTVFGESDVAGRLAAIAAAADEPPASGDLRLAARARNAAGIAVPKSLHDDLLLLGRRA